MSAMILYKTGDPCPLCGQPIKTRHPADLYALSAIAHLLGLNDVARTEQALREAESMRKRAAEGGGPYEEAGGGADYKPKYSAVPPTKEYPPCPPRPGIERERRRGE